MRSANLELVVDHRQLTLPQLCANGVEGRQLSGESGWQVEWGPVRAGDILPYFESGRKKTQEMRQARFPLKDRLEMASVALGFYALLVLLTVLIFWRHLLLPAGFSLVGLSYFYAVIQPWLPGRDGLYKSVSLALLSLIGLGGYIFLWGGLGAPVMFGWGVGLVCLSILVAAESQGMSPVMRGEQANWLPLSIIFGLLGVIYWLVPLAMGWR